MPRSRQVSPRLVWSPVTSGHVGRVAQHLYAPTSAIGAPGTQPPHYNDSRSWTRVIFSQTHRPRDRRRFRPATRSAPGPRRRRAPRGRRHPGGASARGASVGPAGPGAGASSPAWRSAPPGSARRRARPPWLRTGRALRHDERPGIRASQHVPGSFLAPAAPMQRPPAGVVRSPTVWPALAEPAPPMATPARGCGARPV